MTPAQVNRFFPRMSTDTSRAWVNISPARSAIDVWISGALELRRSVNASSILEMADRFGLRSETSATQQRSLEDPEALFCLEGSNHGAEIAKAAFLLRAGKVCGFEITATATLERLLEEVFSDYLQSVSDKMASWKVSGATQKAILAT
jgi:hypothetical protein